MANVELLIKLPEEIYKASQILDVKFEDTIQIPLEVIANGTPLPKGHGRLIDADDIRVIELEDSLHIIRHEKGDEIDVYIDAPTVIESDTEEREDREDRE